MTLVRYRGGPHDGEERRFVTTVPRRLAVTAHEGGGFSNVDSFYEYDGEGVMVWQGPDR